MILSSESQKAIVVKSGILDVNPGSMENVEVAMYSINFGSRYGDSSHYSSSSSTVGPSRLNKNYNKQCDFCKIK